MGRTPNSLLEHALAYASDGFSVIPLGEGSKKPAIEWAPFIRERASDDQITSWWEKHPAYNIGLVTGRVSGMIVVDVDPGASPQDIHRDDPTGLIASTPRGGFHLFYRYTNGGPNVQTRAGVRPHIDVRGDGGYVVAAPSIVNGKTYVWESHNEPGSKPPAWTARPEVVAATKDEHGGRSQSWLSDMLSKGVERGERNQSLTRITGYLAKQKIPEDVARAIMGNWNSVLTESLPSVEIERTVRSVYEGDRSRSIAATPATTEPWAVSLESYMRAHVNESQDWTVDQWLPARTCALVVSPPGVFKTWLLTDLAIAIASGTPFLGQFEIRNPGPVLFIQQEDPHSEILSRFACCWTTRLAEIEEQDDRFQAYAMPRDLPIYIHPHRQLRLDDAKQMDQLRQTVREIKPRAVMIDPLYSTAGTDDFMASSAGKMLAYKELRDEIGCSFIIAHHTKKSAEGTGRLGAWGSQFLNAWLETGWQIRPGAGSSAIVHRHFKVSESTAEIGLRFDISDRFNVEIIDAAETKRDGGSTQQADILVHLTTAGPQSVAELAEALGKKPFSIRRSVTGLASKGQINEGEDKRWSVV